MLVIVIAMLSAYIVNLILSFCNKRKIDKRITYLIVAGMLIISFSAVIYNVYYLDPYMKKQFDAYQNHVIQQNKQRVEMQRMQAFIRYANASDSPAAKAQAEELQRKLDAMQKNQSNTQ